MQQHGCSISRPQFYDNHMKCIHVSTELPNNATNGVVSSSVFLVPHPTPTPTPPHPHPTLTSPLALCSPTEAVHSTSSHAYWALFHLGTPVHWPLAALAPRPGSLRDSSLPAT